MRLIQEPILFYKISTNLVHSQSHFIVKLYLVAFFRPIGPKTNNTRKEEIFYQRPISFLQTMLQADFNMNLAMDLIKNLARNPDKFQHIFVGICRCKVEDIQFNSCWYLQMSGFNSMTFSKDVNRI